MHAAIAFLRGVIGVMLLSSHFENLSYFWFSLFFCYFVLIATLYLAIVTLVFIIVTIFHKCDCPTQWQFVHILRGG